MHSPYSIRVNKQYFNFAAGHFLIFPDGSREPLHGHNYRVEVELFSRTLFDDLVFDFLDFKPIVRKICDSFDHKLLIPLQNPHLKIYEKHDNFELLAGEKSFFSVPKEDVLFLPLPNTSVERLSILIAEKIRTELKALNIEAYQSFEALEVLVEETPGQSAIHRTSSWN